METRVLIRPGPKPNAGFPPPQMLQIKFGCNRPLVLEIFMFEIVNGHTDTHTDTRTPARVLSYKLTL